ncbi:MAG: PAS domain S-box protein [Candidatus Sericytochromatia bacterium]|nr:PAS domain S-box protein [Candidatus Sericytochromatia bacterium]
MLPESPGWLPQPRHNPGRWLPARTALMYTLLGCVWILCTDGLVAWIFPEPHLQQTVQTFKGWFFILMMSGFLYLIINRDFATLRRSQLALQDSESRLRAIVAHGPDGVLILSADGTLREINAAGLALLEADSAEQVVGTSFWDWVNPVHEDAVRALFSDLAQRPAGDLSCEMIGRRGTARWCATRAVRLPETNGEPATILAIARDVSDAKHAESRLQRLTRLYSVQGEINQAIVRIGSRDALFQVVCRILAEQGGFRLAWVGHVNEVGGRVNPVCHSGYEAGYLEGIRITTRSGPEASGPSGVASRQGRSSIVHDIASDPAMAPWARAALERGYRSSAAFPLWERGTVRWILSLYASDSHFFDAVETELMETIAADLSYALAAIYQEKQRRQADLALAEEKERLAVTLRSIGDGVITTDTGGYVVLMNKIAEELTGWTQEEAVGRPLAEIYGVIGERSRTLAENPVPIVLRTNGLVDMASDRLLLARGGREISVADSGSPIRNADGAIIGVVVVFRDITDKRKLEDELLKSRKLESLGVLAGGIAHDFNNLLASILGSISLALAVVDPSDRIHRRLAEAEKACLRARDLTQQLLTFAKGGIPVKHTTLIADLIHESASFATTGANTRCEFDFDPELWPVEVDEGQISQVINNLIINADQASPNGGIVEIRAVNTTVQDAKVALLKPGPYVKIAVSDQGTGIAFEHLPKIFDPYFTTKENGNGLGLASAYAIIRKHDGYIDVDSGPGTGTTFTIYLPAAPNEQQRRTRTEDSVISGKGRILIMDDASSIRELMGEMLTFLGYDVAFAADGNAALEIYTEARAAGHPCDAVIMDLTVPGGMGGKEATRQLLLIDPEARVIVSSGYSNDPIMSEFRQFGFRAVIAKPYRIADLGAVLASVLDDESATGKP